MFHTVLVGVDDRPGGADAVTLAQLLAGAPARIVLASVYGAGRVPGRGGALAIAAERAQAVAVVTGAQQATRDGAGTVVCHGRALGRTLHQLAEREGADLLVVGSSHRGPLGAVLLGDDTTAALSGAACVVAVAPRGYAAGSHRRREPGPRRLEAIGVGVDGSTASERALVAARELARSHGATIRTLTVADGDPGEELVKSAEQLDLLIVGSRGSGPVERLLHSSTVAYLARYAGCPLLVLPRALAASARGRADQPPELARLSAARAS